MNKQRYGDGSTSLHWVEIAYGSDDAEATVEAHAWMDDANVGATGAEMAGWRPR